MHRLALLVPCCWGTQSLKRLTQTAESGVGVWIGRLDGLPTRWRLHPSCSRLQRAESLGVGSWPGLGRDAFEGSSSAIGRGWLAVQTQPQCFVSPMNGGWEGGSLPSPEV